MSGNGFSERPRCEEGGKKNTIVLVNRIVLHLPLDSEVKDVSPTVFHRLEAWADRHPFIDTSLEAYTVTESALVCN